MPLGPPQKEKLSFSAHVQTVSSQQWTGCIGLPTWFVLFKVQFNSDGNLNMVL